MEEIIKTFLFVNNGYSDNYDYSNSHGFGDGLSNGYGYSYGYGSGYGNNACNSDDYSNGYGYGDGDGDGNGYGDGYGSSSGSNSGYGSGYSYGDGDGYGYGDGYGDGDGLKSINEQEVYMIDKISTVLYSIHNNYAKGGIVNSDLTITPCYIAKVGNYFAHGETLRQAFEDAKEKQLRALPIEERIAKVVEKYPLVDASIPHKELYDLHHILTGSCTMGRQEFAKAHNLDPKHGSMTMKNFLALTTNAYGGEIIKQLAKAYGLQNV